MVDFDVFSLKLWTIGNTIRVFGVDPQNPSLETSLTTMSEEK